MPSRRGHGNQFIPGVCHRVIAGLGFNSVLTRDDSTSALEEKWQFEGHQLGVVSVAADLQGSSESCDSHVHWSGESCVL